MIQVSFLSKFIQFGDHNGHLKAFVQITNNKSSKEHHPPPTSTDLPCVTKHDRLMQRAS